MREQGIASHRKRRLSTRGSYAFLWELRLPMGATPIYGSYAYPHAWECTCPKEPKGEEGQVRPDQQPGQRPKGRDVDLDGDLNVFVLAVGVALVCGSFWPFSLADD